MPTKVEFFNDIDVAKLENAINAFLEKDITVISMQQSQSSYISTDPDTDLMHPITEITVCIYYQEITKYPEL